MIIKFYDLKKNLKQNKFFLLYGSNKGLIEETIKNILKPGLTGNIYTYDESEILNDIENFKETIFNKSFFENEKLIIVNRVSEKIKIIMEEIIEKNLRDVFIILTSGVLEKKSKLRNFFEKNKELIIVPFYEDNNQTLSLIAQKFFQEKGIKISQQNINLIIERSKGERTNLKNELEKIENFYVNKKKIDIEDILKLTNLAENYSMSELVDNCLARNKKKTFNIINENNFSTEDNILLLRTFLYKLKRLRKIKYNMKITNSIETVISSYKPPIFWKEKEIIKQQIQIWSYEKIQELIINVNKLELLTKKNPQISTNLINDFILENTQRVNN